MGVSALENYDPLVMFVSIVNMTTRIDFKPFTPELKKYKCISAVVGIGSIIIFHLSKL